MIISREKVLGRLEEFLSPEDQKHIDLITDLSWLATIVLEFGFQCPKKKQKVMRNKLIQLVQKFSRARVRAEIPVDLRQYKCECALPERVIPTTKDLAIVCDLYHDLTTGRRKIASGALISWIRNAWAVGAYQQRIYCMEVEGGILNQTGMICNFGADLAMSGVSEGLIPG